MNYTPVLDDLLDFDGFDMGLDSYDIWGDTEHIKEENREHLNNKIFDYYRFRQIGQETAERFVWAINETMNRIMPSYVELYQNTREAVTGKKTKTTNDIAERVRRNEYGAQTDNVSGSDAQSNTPQNNITLNLNSFSGYATQVGKTTSEQTKGAHNDKVIDEESVDHSFTEELLGWADINERKIICDIEQMIIEDEALNECFMLIY